MNPQNLQSLKDTEQFYGLIKYWGELTTLILAIVTVLVMYLSKPLSKWVKSLLKRDKRRWSEKRIADYTNRGLQTITVILLLITFVIGLQLSSVTEKRTEAERKIEVKQKQQSEERIARSDSKSEQAKADATLANRDAQLAKATAEAAKVEQQKLAIESRQGQQALLKSQKLLSDAQRKQAQAELALRKNIEEVREKQAPRSLTDQQKHQITSILKGVQKGPIHIEVGGFDDESSKFSSDIIEAMNEAGWRIGEDDIFRGHILAGDVSGTVITVKNINHAPAHASALIQAFRKTGIKFRIEENSNAEMNPYNSIVEPGRFTLFVGIKPRL